AFYSDLTNLIASNPSPAAGRPTVPYYGNIGEARIYGVEVEASYDSELFYANLAYGLTIGDNLVTNTPLTTVPQTKLSTTLGIRNVEYNLDMGARLTIADIGRYIVAPSAFGGDGPA